MSTTHINTSPDDSSERAFKAYTEQDFKTCKEILDTQRKQAEDLKSTGGDSKRMSLIKQNLLLTNYYQNKGQSPHKLLADLQLLSQQFMPQIQIAAAQVPPKLVNDCELNTMLMYNCAVMSYQTQQLGVCLGNLTLILQYLDQFELFLQIKSLFLLLQVLYEMRQPEPSQPILHLLEAKFMDLKAITAQKQQIKDFQVETSQSDATPTEESKSQATEVFDETIVSKNCFCILMGAYLRRYAVSPKNINLHEFQFLFHTFSAMFKILKSDLQGASEDLVKANEQRSGVPQDSVQYQPAETQKLAGQQHMGMLRYTKAMLEHARGNEFGAARSLYVSEKEQSSVGPHKSCFHQKRAEQDLFYQKCKQMHPQFYYNNLGILHLRLRKFKMATLYFSKSLKFLEQSQTTTPNVPQTSEKAVSLPWGESFTQPFSNGSTHEHVGNTTSQHSVEILFNMGISLYKDGSSVDKLDQAFRCFEKVSNSLKGNPKLWYYMALTVIKLNKQLQEQLANKQPQSSDVCVQKFGYSIDPDFKKIDRGDLKRLQLVPKGDKLSQLYAAIQEKETDYIDRLKSVQSELAKNRQKQTTNMSKAQLKKQEKAYQQAWGNTNTPPKSMQLYNAVQYLQNALVAIQNEISNSQRYTLLFRYLHNAHLLKMQQSYNDLHAKLSPEHMSESEAQRRQSEASAGKKESFGEDGWQYPILDYPQTPTSVQQFNQSQKAEVEKKYETMVKNIYFYLSFVNLELDDYAGCVRNGNELLRRFSGKLSCKTEFTCKQYLAEAYCMLGMSKEALKHLQEGSKTDLMQVTSTCLQTTLPDKLSCHSIMMVNQAAVKLCANDILGAKDTLDELLNQLDVKLVTPVNTSDTILPQFLIHTLVYFFLKTKNFKMARQLTKHRRLVVEAPAASEPTVQRGTRAAPPTLQPALKSFS